MIEKPSQRTKQTSELKIATDLRKTLIASPSIAALWKNLTPIAQRDFIRWIDSAKQPKTRKHRIETLGSRLASGKRRPCCYAVVPLKLYTALNATPKAKAQWKSLTPSARRDFIDWIDSIKEPQTRELRIEKTCILLAAGRQHL